MYGIYIYIYIIYHTWILWVSSVLVLYLSLHLPSSAAWLGFSSSTLPSAPSSPPGKGKLPRVCHKLGNQYRLVEKRYGCGWGQWYLIYPPLNAWGMAKLAFHKTIGFMKCRNHVDFLLNARTKQEILIKCINPPFLVIFLWNATSLQITTPYTKCRDCMKTFPIMTLSVINQHSVL